MSSERNLPAYQAPSSNSDSNQRKIRAIPRPKNLESALVVGTDAQLGDQSTSASSAQAAVPGTSQPPRHSDDDLATELSNMSDALSLAIKAWRMKAETTATGGDRTADSTSPHATTIRPRHASSSYALHGTSASAHTASRVKALSDGIDELDKLLQCLHPLDKTTFIEDQDLDRDLILTKVYIHRMKQSLRSRIGQSGSDDHRPTGSSGTRNESSTSSTATRVSQPTGMSKRLDTSESLQSAIKVAERYLQALKDDDGLGDMPDTSSDLLDWIDDFDTEAYSQEVRTLQRGMQEERASLIGTPALTVKVETV